MNIPLTLALVLASFSAGAAECTVAEGKAAFDSALAIKSWPDVNAYFRTFGHCHDGGISEAVQDNVDKLWADHWEQLPEMLELARKDPKFKAFLWAQIGSELTPQDTFATIVQHAREQCPKEGQDFCAEVLAQQAKWAP